MPYRIEKSEPLAKGLRRIAIEQIEKAIESLRAPEKGRNVAVHECRKSLKKLRALLRLVRHEIGDDLYRQENRALRDIAAGLSAMRDADVLIGTLVSLHQWAGARLEGDEASAVATAIEKKRSRVADAGTTPEEAIEQSIGLLESALERAQEWAIERNRFVAISDGIRQSYRAGRRSYARVLEDPIEENLHEWRKQVKYLWYMCRILSRALKVSHKDLVDDLDRLAKLLGEDRDLELLRARALDTKSATTDSTIIMLIDERRAVLQESAKSLGSRLYNRKPKAFVRKVREDWEEFRG